MNTFSQELKGNWKTPFFTVWIGQALSLVGSRVGGFALVWWLTQASGQSAVVLALASLVAMLPSAVLGPFVGALVDRWNRRRVMIVADSIIALFSAGLVILFATGRVQIWHIYVITFVGALGGTFHFAAMQASTSLMVPKEQLARVGGMNQTLQGILGIATPPLGAFLMQVMPLWAIMVIDVVTAALAVAPLFFVHIPQPEPESMNGAETARRSLWQDVKASLAYIWSWKGMFLVLVLATVINFLINPAMSLLPILVTKHFGGVALQLGWINSMWGLGTILGGLTLSVWGGFKSKTLTSLVALIGMGLGLLVVGVVPGSAFAGALVGMGLAGFMNVMVNGPFFALLQEVVDLQYQARVFTVVTSGSSAAALFGLGIAGPFADRMGVQVWFVWSGVICILGGAGMLAVPAMKELEAHGRAAARRLNGEAPAIPD